MNELMKACLN